MFVFVIWMSYFDNNLNYHVDNKNSFCILRNSIIKNFPYFFVFIKTSFFPIKNKSLLKSKHEIFMKQNNMSREKVVYVLLLEQNKYYIGITNNFCNRLQQHCDGKGATWTNKYKVVDVIKVNPESEGNEDQIVIQSMIKYGTDNVRGGKYCQLVFDDLTRSMIDRDIRQKESACFHCGDKGHFVMQCPTKVNKKVEPVVNNKMIKNQFCTRCKRNNHNKTNCFAKKTIDGKIITKK